MEEVIYTVTDLARMFDIRHPKNGKPDAIKMNLILRDIGLQRQVGKKWIPTEKYAEHSFLVSNSYGYYYTWKEDAIYLITRGMARLLAEHY